MKIKLLIFLGLALAGIRGMSAQAGTLPIDGWESALDEAIGAHKEYVAVREVRIEALRQQLAQTDKATTDYFRLNAEMYQEYKAYICDSALYYLSRNLRWAQQHEDREAADETRIRRAHLMSAAGMYKEASEDLEKINPGELSSRLLPDYYECYRHLYGELGVYTQDTFRRGRYYSLSAGYGDSLMQVLSPTSAFYLERREMEASASRQLEEALKINDTRLASVRPDTPEYALVTYHRSMLYRLLGDREQEKYYLALSALTDIRLAITDHASLWTLAQLLYEEGDIERAYRYIRFSWSETNHYNARSRSLQTAGILSLIDLTYQAMQEKQNGRLRFYLLLISVLSLLLVIAIVWIYRQMKHLSVARSHLEQANEQLQMSNHIKEEYIGRFLKLCSAYIDRLDAYRRMVNKKLSGGQTEELLKMVRSRDVLDTDLKELYENFDTAFLHLFPDFVGKFNKLLQPEERIVLRKGELLNTELRIFALIRLGIDDSSQIAEFLRYSVNTIYNYRAKVKNKACISRDDFETCVMKIR
ncbi:DUF6377 domain-containing protein [Bacteroides oleiciplenus]|uniref:Transcriptional regulator n=1 Tax=Bacteroides oleiciplenus TaxID=626931 RepID=A0A3E5B306_9BACE|nr:DUF6377 domain-containing protein [Bacteroides oleiciplenus]RGN31950.1 transcriptional regulator [Bacteroides oleiciplenus]